MVLYRKYRPQIFKDIVGQNHIKDTILSVLAKGDIPHAYLFSGPRGTGKTSTARILAKSVNCLKATDKFGEPCDKCESCLAVTDGNHLDLIEIDAASNRGIEEIRELREKIKLAPSSGRYKVYIIDEAHMLTRDAFNALLKTLEEPPPHAIFILATTEPQKIPATISSRTSNFEFKTPSAKQIKEKLSSIGKKESWKIADDALEEIAKAGAGAFRDAEVLLERVASVDQKADRGRTLTIIGKKDVRDSAGLLELLEAGKTKSALVWLNDYLTSGGSVRVLSESILETLRKILLLKADASEVLEPIDEEEMNKLRQLSSKTSKKRLLELTDLFNKSIEDLRESTIPQLPLEIAIVEATLDSLGGWEQEETAGAKRIIEEKGVEETAPNEVGEPEPKKETEVVSRSVGNEHKKSEEPKKPAKNEQKVFKKIRSNWGKLVNESKRANSSLVHFLKEAKPVDLDEDLLTVEFSFPFHKQKAEEHKYREIIETALEKIAGTPIRLKGKIGQKPKIVKRINKQEERKEVDPVDVFGKLE